MPEADLKTDVLIIGAGPVGMTLALALAGGAQRVLLVDRRPRGVWVGDPRALALSHGSRQFSNASRPGMRARRRRSGKYTFRSAAALAVR